MRQVEKGDVKKDCFFINPKIFVVTEEYSLRLGTADPSFLYARLKVR